MEVAVNFELDCTLRTLWMQRAMPDDLVEYVRQIVRRLAGSGVDRVNWRCTLGGKAMYHSNVLQRFDGHYALYSEPEADLLRRCDPLTVVVDECNRNGIAAWAWLDAFDSYVPGMHEAIFERHPSWLLQSKDGNSVMPGIGCYGNRAFCEYRRQQFAELSEYDISGIVYSLFNSHASPYLTGALAGTASTPYSYGFNPEIVQAFRERFGADIRTESFDVDAWATLQAEQFGQHLLAVRSILRAKGQKLSLVIRRDNHVAGDMYPACYIANAYHHWCAIGGCDELIIEGLAPETMAGTRALIDRDPHFPWGFWRTLWTGNSPQNQQVIDWAAEQPEWRCAILHEVDPLESGLDLGSCANAYSQLTQWVSRLKRAHAAQSI